MPTEFEVVENLAKRLRTLVADHVAGEKFKLTFRGIGDKAATRALASRLCFLEWIAIYSCKNINETNAENIAVAFHKVLKTLDLSEGCMLEEFFADADEQRLVFARLIEEGKSLRGTSIRDCVLAAMVIRCGTYFSILRKTNDLMATLMEIARAIQRQVAGGKMETETKLMECVGCLLEDWNAVKALDL